MDSQKQKVGKKKQNGGSKKNFSEKKPKKITSADHLVRRLHKFLEREGLSHLKEKPHLASVEEKRMIRRNFIPFYLPEFGEGTQVPALNVALLPLVIVTTAGTVNQQVYTVTPGSFTSGASLSLLFDEVRFLGVQFRYDGNLVGGAAALGAGRALSVAVIDFDDNSVISTYNQGVSYDNKEIYDLAPPSVNHMKWNARLDWMPDQQWYDTAASTNIMFWKNFTSTAHGLGTQSLVGVLSGNAVVQFRQFRN